MSGRIRLEAEDALVVVDLQNDFCPGGRLAVPDGDAVVAPINRLMARFRHVVLTQDWHPPGHGSFASAHPGAAPYDTISMPYGPQVLWPDHCVQGSPGAAFHPGLDLTPAELILRKGTDPRIDSYSAFAENDRTTATGLAGYLRERGIGRVIVSGIRTEQCCETTARVASDLGFAVDYVTEATLTFPMIHAGSGCRYDVQDIKQRTELVLDGRFARIRTVDELLADH